MRIKQERTKDDIKNTWNTLMKFRQFIEDQQNNRLKKQFNNDSIELN